MLLFPYPTLSEGYEKCHHSYASGFIPTDVMIVLSISVEAVPHDVLFPLLTHLTEFEERSCIGDCVGISFPVLLYTIVTSIA